VESLLSDYIEQQSVTSSDDGGYTNVHCVLHA
jgi:hypothetical protein